MNTKQLINGIIDLDNENKTLKNLLNSSNDKALITYTVFDEIKDEIFLNGLKYSVSEHFSPFIYPDEIFNKDTNKFIPFELWVQGVTIDKYNRRYFSDKIQDNLSNKEIIELYEPYLRHKYNLMVKVKKEFLNESCES